MVKRVIKTTYVKKRRGALYVPNKVTSTSCGPFTYDWGEDHDVPETEDYALQILNYNDLQDGVPIPPMKDIESWARRAQINFHPDKVGHHALHVSQVFNRSIEFLKKFLDGKEKKKNKEEEKKEIDRFNQNMWKALAKQRSDQLVEMKTKFKVDTVLHANNLLIDLKERHLAWLELYQEKYFYDLSAAIDDLENADRIAKDIEELREYKKHLVKMEELGKNFYQYSRMHIHALNFPGTPHVIWPTVEGKGVLSAAKRMLYFHIHADCYHRSMELQRKLRAYECMLNDDKVVVNNKKAHALRIERIAQMANDVKRMNMLRGHLKRMLTSERREDRPLESIEDTTGSPDTTAELARPRESETDAIVDGQSYKDSILIAQNFGKKMLREIKRNASKQKAVRQRQEERASRVLKRKIMAPVKEIAWAVAMMDTIINPHCYASG